jgi:hypothetical protein
MEKITDIPANINAIPGNIADILAKTAEIGLILLIS